jgi:hypothetical protein
MNRRKFLKMLGAAGAAATAALALTAGPMTQVAEAGYGRRQYYSGWSHSSYGYYYRYYYYKPAPYYSTYNYHYVVYYPSQPRYYYYYNPYSGAYWGRYDLQGGHCGKGQYSLLAEKDRKGNLDDIGESAFPKPGEMPPVPETKDGAKIQPPPDDAPKEAAKK